MQGHRLRGVPFFGVCIMSLVQLRPSSRTLFVSLVVCVRMLITASPSLRAEVFVDDRPVATNRPAAIASDLEPVPPEEIAREVLRLQQQLGGSVVTDRPSLQDWDESPMPATPKQATAYRPKTKLSASDYTPDYTPRPIDKVGELRKAVWQLETTAHRLENLELYDQADALRHVANQLRNDAREMKLAADISALGPSQGKNP